MLGRGSLKNTQMWSVTGTSVLFTLIHTHQTAEPTKRESKKHSNQNPVTARPVMSARPLCRNFLTETQKLNGENDDDTRLTAIFQKNRAPEFLILDFIGAKDDGSGDNWSSKTTKLQPSRHQQQTNTQLFTGPTNSVEALKEKYHIPWTCSPEDLPTLSLTTRGSWLPWGGF